MDASGGRKRRRLDARDRTNQYLDYLLLENNCIEEVDEILKRYFLHLTNGSTDEIDKYPNLTPVNSNVYFTSFSAKEDNIQMWAPYADGAEVCT